MLNNFQEPFFWSILSVSSSCNISFADADFCYVKLSTSAYIKQNFVINFCTQFKKK